MVDAENIIIGVEKYECLWKTTSKEYMNRDLKRISWVKVAKAVTQNWEQKINSEKEDLGK